MERPILQTISALCAGKLSGAEATDRLRLLDASPWLIASVEEIERDAASKLEWFGPMTTTIRRVSQ